MIQFLQPWIALLLPLPLFAYFILPALKSQTSTILKVPFLEHIQTVVGEVNSLNQHNKKYWFFPVIIWLLIVAGACHPVWIGNPTVIPMVGRNIILAVDLSGSMQIPDMSLAGEQTSRLAIVKKEAKTFIQGRKGDRLGLILFGTKAYVQTPLTFDRQTVMNMLNDATIGLAGTQTAIGDAIGLAIKQLMTTPEKGRILVLLTDGGNNSGSVLPLAAAAMAEKFHIRIYTVGLGADEIVVPGFWGPQIIHPTSDLDQETLKKIAQMTGGLFFRAQNGQDLAKVYGSINQIEPVAATSTSYQTHIELYPWFLGGALGIIMLIYFCNSLISNKSKNRQ